LPEGFELRTVEVPAHLEGRTLAELAPRSAYGVHVIAVKRRDPVTGRTGVDSPDPQKPLRPGDGLVVIGTFEHIAAFLAALATDVANLKP
jgi:K+/H+ antiporter YhaU regulatory subunit KhtT